eukprot:5850142-Alexandrium_andersonii.AAC.1
MSASLVGSEMCIRDRPLPALVPALALLPGLAPVPLPGPAPALGPGVAVSYTHLTLPTICSV